MEYTRQLVTAIEALDPRPLYNFVAACEGTLWLAGNGGSAAIAQHWACDLSKTAGRRTGALGANSAVLTAYSNDDHYASALASELERSARPTDSVLCFSCSGTSPNIVTLLRQAWLMRLPRAIVTGPRSVWPTPIDLVVNIPAAHYGILEDCFQILGHAVTEALCSR